MEIHLWEPRLEAPGAHPSVPMDTMVSPAAWEGTEWAGRKRSPGGWGMNAQLHPSHPAALSAAGAAAEPPGETRAPLPWGNPRGRTGLEVPHLTPQKRGNERLPVKQIPALLPPLCLACLEVSEQWVIFHTLLLCCRTASTAIKTRVWNSNAINNLAFPFL